MLYDIRNEDKMPLIFLYVFLIVILFATIPKAYGFEAATRHSFAIRVDLLHLLFYPLNH